MLFSSTFSFFKIWIERVHILNHKIKSNTLFICKCLTKIELYFHLCKVLLVNFYLCNWFEKFQT